MSTALFVFTFLLLGHSSFSQSDTLSGYCTNLYSRASSLEDISSHVTIKKEQKQLQLNEYQDSVCICIERCLAESNWKDWYSGIRTLYSIGKKSDFLFLENWLSSVISTNPTESAEENAKFRYLKSFVFEKQGRLFESIALQKANIEYYQSNNLKSKLSKAFKNISVTSSMFNDHETAIRYAFLHKEYMNEGDEKEYLAFLRNLAKYYHFNGDYLKSLNVIEEKERYSPLEKQELIIFKMKNLISLGRVEEAKKLLDQESEGLQGNFELEYLLLQSNYFLELKDYRKVLDLYDKQRPIVMDAYDSREMAKWTQSLSKVQFELGMKEDALNTTREVLDYFCRGTYDSNIEILPDSSQIRPEAWLKESLHLIARINFDSSLELKDSLLEKRAYKATDLAIFTIDILRQQFLTIGSKYKMSELSLSVFSDAIAFSLDRYKVTNDYYYYNKALQYAQKAKAYAYKESTSIRLALESANVPSRVISEYLNLLNKRDSGQSDDFVNYSQSVDSIEQELQNNYSYINTSNLSEIISVVDIMESLDEDQALLHYYLDNKVLYCFTITSSRFDVYQKTATTDMASLKDNYIRSLTDFHYIAESGLKAEADFLNSSKTIYNLALSEPLNSLSSNINHLIIVPDGLLKKVSFSTLPYKHTDSWKDYSSLIVSKYATSYLYNTSQLNSFSRLEKINSTGFIGLDFSKDFIIQDGRDLSMGYLPAVKEELESMKEKFGSSVNFNECATLDNVIYTLSNTDLIHYSGHSILDTLNYKLSYIPLFVENGSFEKFTYEDIACLNLEAKLIVLNACNSSNGTEVSTESNFSLSKAFALSGVSSVIGTLWNAPDRPSKQIMELFYDQLVKGSNKAKSIQQAQLEYLSNDNMSSPNIRIPPYWAHIYLLGDSCPIIIGETSSWYWYLLMTVLLLFGFGLSIVRKSTNE